MNVGVSLHGLRFSLKEIVLKFIREKNSKAGVTDVCSAFGPGV